MKICGDVSSWSDSVRYGSDEEVEAVSSSPKASSTSSFDAMYIRHRRLIAKIFEFEILKSLEVCMRKEVGVWK